MGQAVEHDADELATGTTKIPRPFPGGSYSVESLGSWVDRLTGARRARAEAAANLEPLLARDDEPSWEPEPAEVPEPVPGGSEPITKGDKPGTERR